MSSWVETLKEDDFAAHACSAERAIQVSLTGTADLTVKDQLDLFLREVHSEAQKSQSKKSSWMFASWNS